MAKVLTLNINKLHNKVGTSASSSETVAGKDVLNLGISA